MADLRTEGNISTDDSAGAGSPGSPAGSLASATVANARRHRLRVAAIGGIAAAVIAGGGAVAAASAPVTGGQAVAASTTATVSPTSPAAPKAAPGAPSTATGGVPKMRTHSPHLDGAVTAVAGTTVTIKDRDGFTRSIVVSAKTTYNDGLKAALPVGTQIVAEGTVDANGTALDATTIGARPAPGMHGGPGRGGPRGSGGVHGDRGNGKVDPPSANGPTTPGQSGSAPSTSSPAPTTS